MSAEGGSAPPPPLPAPGEGRGGLKKPLVLVVIAILIVAALAGGLYVILSAPPTPSGPQLASVQLTTTPKSTLNQTETVTISAVATDTNGVDRTSEVTWSWSASPSAAVNLTQILASRVTARGGNQTGTVTVTAQASLGSSQKSGTASLTVEAIAFNLVAQGQLASVGEPFSITVTVVKSSTGGVYTGYDGTIHFTSTDSVAFLPPNGPVLQGTRIFTDFQFGTSGVQTVTVTDTFASTVTGSVSVRADRRPAASFTNQSSPNDRRVVTFTSTSTDPDGDAITRYDWEFGDGSTQSISTASVSHTYTVTGTVPVNLTAFDTWGLPSAKNSTKYLISTPPVAFFQVNGSAAVGTNIRVYVNASKSTGSIQTYGWTWDDGSPMSDYTVPTAYHDYGPAFANKNVNITLNVTDVYGVWDTHKSQVLVTILPLPPVASFEITAKDNITFQVSVDGRNSTDPNGNIATFRWDWGDGNFTVKNYGPANQTATWTYAREGTYSITLTVTDSTALSNSQSKPISLFRPQLPPIPAFVVIKSGYRVDANASATTDPNGAADIATYNWTWGDGKQNEFTVPTASHTYPSTPALYAITLKVTDKEGHVGTTTRKVSIAATTFDYTFWDFFQVPYKDYWDFRGDKYGDLPIGVTCFNKTAALVYNKCAANALNPVPISQRTYYTTPPYTDWYPSPGSIRPGHTGNNPFIFAPYRFKVIAANVPGYNVSEPVFVPVLNYGGQLGPNSYLTFDWRFAYASKPMKDYIVATCGKFGFDDGFDTTSVVNLTMDLKTSGRLFGVDTSSIAKARTWWSTNADRDCTKMSPIEISWDAWFEAMGGNKQKTGKYDVANSCEWYYVDFMIQVNATVANDGTTNVKLWTMAYCQEILLTRWFYWGNTSYMAHWDDSTKARGWWGMELAWFEDMAFTGTLTTTDTDFSLNTVMQYHFQQEALPGPDGKVDKINDIPTWTWRPFLTDYTNDWNPSTHYISELDRYPTGTYLHSTPGSPFYGLQHAYDVAYVTWSPKAGEDWHFLFPKGNVIFYDPRTAAGANPTKPFTTDPTVARYIKIVSPLVYYSQRPAAFGDWDGSAMMWDIYGAATPPLGPDGSPGKYALDETTPGVAASRIVQPKIVFRNATAGAAGLVNPVKATGSGLGSSASGSVLAFGDGALVRIDRQATPLTVYVRRKSQ